LDLLIVAKLQSRHLGSWADHGNERLQSLSVQLFSSFLDFINGTQVPSGDSWSPFAFARLKAHGKLLFKIRQKNNLIDKDSKQTPVVLTSLTAWQQILTKVFGHWALGVSAFMNNQRNPRPLGGDSRLSPGGRLARQCHHGKG
jgi:hypothetical protein